MGVTVVAEISGNHGGSLEKAKALICEAAEAGCDYAKFQYYVPEDMPDADEGDNRKMYEKLMVPSRWLPQMFQTARMSSIGLFASVFSVRAVKELLEYDVPYIKIASSDSTSLPLETYMAIAECVPPDVDIIWSGRNQPGVRKMLYCPLGHPPTITWGDFAEFRLGNYYGFSDHTWGIRTPLAFARAGAEMIEKHFMLESRDLNYREGAPVDWSFSADPQTMKQLCRLIKT